MQNMEDIYKEHAKLVHHYLLTLTHNGDIAEDLTQETFYRALKNSNKFEGKCKVSVWLCQIAKFTWYQYLNKQKKTEFVSIDEIGDSVIVSKDLEEEFWLKQDKIELFKRLQDLDRNYRDVLYLRLTGELSFKEMGEILEKSENWARVTYYRGKKKLLEAYQIEGGTENE